MKVYRLVVNSDNGIQTTTDVGAGMEELMGKDRYAPYSLEYIDWIVLCLDKGAKLTDVLSIGGLGKGNPVKYKYCDILKEFSLHNIQFIPIARWGLEDYQFMLWYGDLTPMIDYKKSDFHIIEDFLGDVTVIDDNIPQNRDSVLEAYNANFGPLMYTVPQNGYHFVPDFDITQYDVFRIGHFDRNFYVSERVKDALESNNITGVDFFESKLFEHI